MYRAVSGNGVLQGTILFRDGQKQNRYRGKEAEGRRQ